MLIMLNLNKEIKKLIGMLGGYIKKLKSKFKRKGKYIKAQSDDIYPFF